MTEGISRRRAEMALLGSLIIDPAAIATVAPLVRPDDFASRRCRLVYEAALALHARGEPPDYVTLCCELEHRGAMAEVGGEGVVTALVNYSPTSLHVEHYARVVARQARPEPSPAAEGPPRRTLVDVLGVD